MHNNLKKQTISGILWSSIERFSLGFIQFAINMMMARLLLPSDYGIIGMLAIFLQISQIFVDAGFTNVLIQRLDRTDVDFSTVFYFNIVIAIVFYSLLFFLAPWIAYFYDMPQLIVVTRVIAFTLILNSLSAIHKTILTINVDFKTQSKVSLLAAVFSGVIGLYMAYINWGVWALVTQIILNSLISTLLFYKMLKWKPFGVFSMESFHRLFSFGFKYFLTNMIYVVFGNLYTIVIGKKFSAVDLGYYTCANQIALLPSGNLNAIISRVIFPVLSKIQNEDEQLKNAYRKYIRLLSYVIFPLMVGLAVLAQPIVKLLLTNKWSEVIILLQIICFAWMFDHLSVINLNILYVKGRSDLLLKFEFINKIIVVIILFASVPFGLVGICWGRVVYSLISVFLNTYYTKSLIGLTLFDQIRDILPTLFLALVMGLVVYGVTIHFSNANKLIVGIMTGVIFYGLISVLFKIESYEILLHLVNKLLKI